jgi:peptidoglycan/LPS O-acetylase OafA/YrhL
MSHSEDIDGWNKPFRMSSQASPHGQIPSLNGIRAISVLIVVLSHSNFGTIVPGGLGVTIFFFLSGYLITTLMLTEHDRTGGIDIFRFYARRVFRLIPPLLVTLAFAYGLTFWGRLPGQITLSGLAAQLLYFANYYSLFFDPGNTIPAGTGVLWSLAVEEHFYIFYPLIMTLFLRNAIRLRTIGIVFAITCAVILAWRIHLVKSPDFFEYRTYYASDTRIDSILFGCILAVWINPIRNIHFSKRMSLPQCLLLVVAIGVLLATLIYRGPVFRETLRYSLQGIALMPIFYFAVRFHRNAIFRALNWSWATKLGVYSYAIYLAHDVIINALTTDATAFSTLAPFPIALALSVAYAAAIDYFIDPYFRRLRVQLHARLAPGIAAPENPA